ncbi:TRAP transporter large permease [Devosia neptuniae]|mgnify:CR=1 FL=1|jgi:tripartite ATP-independent transporter DctM subunit|uniref:TRAP transporter large permease n=1 Tax=Devosia TaxID=46913 RepID=UPI0022AEF3E1|nr:TRAP transporter large permease [Devosia neptuniae]MCZ4347929.1 TRAP transporter large permease [Devosia neptuniae]|tara:strand:- start:12012 stop:13313 length:1302 start_codon:yes stop_codon:yes gene_type:complete
MLVGLALPIMLVLLIAATVAGMPMGIAMIVSSIFYLLMAGRDVGLAAEQVLNGVFGNFVALAVPLFIFAANVMNAGQISDRLLKFALAMVGRLPGGLAQVNILTSLIFSGMSGSAVSDVAGVGKVLTNMMIKDNRYPRGFAGAITATSSVVGPIFPPSIPMVFYALISSTSVGALFLGGVVPALMIVVVLAIVVGVLAKLRGFPVEEAIPFRAFPAIILSAIPPLMMPVILLGGIYTGAFTPTEAAAVSAFYALLLAVFAYRSLGLKEFWDVVVSTVRTTAVVTLVLCGAFIFNYVVTVERIPMGVFAFFDQFDLNAAMFFLMINILYLVLGCFLDVSTIMLVITPLFIPTAAALGIDLHHFGIVVVFNMMIGLITPPYGILLFIIKALNGIPLGEMIREIWLFVGVLIALLMVITYFPDLSLWLPRFAGLLG